MNAVAASAAGHDHPAVRQLQAWSTDDMTDGPAHVLWLGERTSGDRAALVNGAMLEVLDFNETHMEGFVHPTAPVWPAVQATAEASGASLAEALDAVALGIEVELAVATMLMPVHYDRGFNPAVIAGAIGAAAGCAVVLGLDTERTTHALGLAAMGGAGPLEALGTPAHPYRVGDAARAGFVAAALSQRGFTAPTFAIEGEHGLLATVAEIDLPKVETVLHSLGQDWRITGDINFKRFPAETISQAPLECTLKLWERTPTDIRPQLSRMDFWVAPLVASVNRGRRQRFPIPEDELQARFDGSYCVAESWHRGRFTTRDLQATTKISPGVLTLREAVTFTEDPHRGVESALLEATFANGYTDRISVEAFRGSSGNPMSDEELSTKFRECTAGLIRADQAQNITRTVWDGGVNLPITRFVAMLAR